MIKVEKGCVQLQGITLQLLAELTMVSKSLYHEIVKATKDEKIAKEKIISAVELAFKNEDELNEMISDLLANLLSKAVKEYMEKEMDK